MTQEATTTITVRAETGRLVTELGQMLRARKDPNKWPSDSDVIHTAVRHVLLRLRKVRTPSNPGPSQRPAG